MSANATTILFIDPLGRRPRDKNKSEMYLAKANRKVLGIKHNASIYHTGMRVKVKNKVINYHNSEGGRGGECNIQLPYHHDHKNPFILKELFFSQNILKQKWNISISRYILKMITINLYNVNGKIVFKLLYRT